MFFKALRMYSMNISYDWQRELDLGPKEKKVHCYSFGVDCSAHKTFYSVISFSSDYFRKSYFVIIKEDVCF